MHYIMGELVIARPVDEVFDFVADLRNELSYDPDLLRLDMVTSGPVAAGTRFTATVRSGRRRHHALIAYRAVERPHLIAATVTASPARVCGTLRFEQVPIGTRLRWCWTIRPTGVWRVTGRVLVRMGERRQQRMLTRLKEHLETRSRREVLPGIVLPTALSAIPVP